MDKAWLAVFAWAIGLMALPVSAATPRIVSANQCSDEMLAWLAPDTLVAVSWVSRNQSYGSRAELIASKPVHHATTEGILALRPDLVIGGEYGAADLFRVLAAIGVRTARLPLVNDLNTLQTTWHQLGVYTQRPSEAAQIVHKIRTGLENHRTRLATRRLSVLLVNPNGWIGGEGTLQDAFLHSIGLHNHARALGAQGWSSLSLEDLVRHPPDLLIRVLPDVQGGSQATAWLEHPVFQRLAREMSMATLPAAWLGCGTPDLLLAAKQIEAHLPLSQSVRPLL